MHSVWVMHGLVSSSREFVTWRAGADWERLSVFVEAAVGACYACCAPCACVLV